MAIGKYLLVLFLFLFCLPWIMEDKTKIETALTTNNPWKKNKK
jgi:hypothetical protein